MLDAASMLADLRMMMADIPQSLTLASGDVVTASITTGPEADDLELSGVTDQTKLTAYCAVADCDIAPVSNDVVIFSGIRYRVLNVTKSDDNVSYMIQAVGEFE